MSWIGVILIVVGVYLAFKVVSFLLKVAMWGLVLAGVYWVVAPLVGWPPLTQLFAG
ncbi:hypothetical protein [Luteimonas panaciterrae]|uniref:hypothetical protein n=1 Tax=Luteimonas panaciterrae TaxID=363885 RepID=UPI001CF977BA|nr:hypothetical protein [Luteimonas panaciterrae]